MASNVTKVGRLPPIGDLGLAPLPHKTLNEIQDRGDAVNGRKSKHSELYSEESGLLKRQDNTDSGLESPNDQKESSSQMIVGDENRTRELGSKAARRKGEKKASKRKRQGYSPRATEKVDDINTENVTYNDHHHLEALNNDKSTFSSAKLGRYNDIEQGSSSKWNTHEAASVERHPSELTEETTVPESESLNNNTSNSIAGSNDGPDKSLRVDYRELAIKLANNYTRPDPMEKRRRTFVDYVLVFDVEDDSEFKEDQRHEFESQLLAEGIEVHRSHIGHHVFVELCCSFKRLCQEAEAIFLEMPLIGVSVCQICAIFSSFESPFLQ